MTKLLTLICQKNKLGKFETDNIQCLDFCIRNVCKLAHISLSNDSFAYLNLTFRKLVIQKMFAIINVINQLGKVRR